MGIGKSPTILDGELRSGHCRTGGLTRIMSRAVTIREGLEPGEHTLTCELLKQTADPEGGLEFRLISIMRYVTFRSTSTCTVRPFHNARSVTDFNIC